MYIYVQISYTNIYICNYINNYTSYHGNCLMWLGVYSPRQNAIVKL